MKTTHIWVFRSQQVRYMNEGPCSRLAGAPGEHSGPRVVNVIKGKVLRFPLSSNHVDDDVGVLDGLHDAGLVLEMELGKQSLKEFAF